MDAMTILFAAAVICGCILGASSRLPKTALAVFVAFVVSAAALQVSLAGLPKPVSVEFVRSETESAQVVGSVYREGVGLYLYLQLPGEDAPMSYVFPWDKQLAEQLQKAQEEAARNGTGVEMRLPFEPTLDPREPKFYAPPQPARPDKPAPAAPRVVEQEA